MKCNASGHNMHTICPVRDEAAHIGVFSAPGACPLCHIVVAAVNDRQYAMHGRDISLYQADAIGQYFIQSNTLHAWQPADIVRLLLLLLRYALIQGNIHAWAW
jgi:hypothetical protein